ncbi:MAG: sigma-70 family RNA polymerase sigma factor [Phycisphaerales bacterium]
MSADPFFDSIAGIDRITPAQEIEFARAWREHGDIQARNHLIEANIRLVRSIARTLEHRGVSLEDLTSEGNVGLVRAAERFDHTCGCRFSTFAFHYVRHSMTALFAQQSTRGRLKHSARRQVTQWSQAVSSLITASGVTPDDQQVAEYLGWTVEEVAKARRLHDNTSSVARDFALQAEAESRQQEFTDPSARLDDEEQQAMRQSVRTLQSILSPRERQAMELLYGFSAPQRLDAKGTAGVMGCSIQDIVRLRAVAHSKLRRHRHLIEKTRR